MGSNKRSEGPHGLGIKISRDPDDLSLRKVELEVMIPKKMREIARTELCSKEVKEFCDCGKNAGLLVVINCRKENDRMKECLTKWYRDEAFKERCTQEYLKERSEYRRTGIAAKHAKRIGS